MRVVLSSGTVDTADIAWSSYKMNPEGTDVESLTVHWKDHATPATTYERSTAEELYHAILSDGFTHRPYIPVVLDVYREPERCCPTCGTPERDQPPEREWKGLR